jgi:AraC-like DNA-binding protein
MSLERVWHRADGTEREVFSRIPRESAHLHRRFELGQPLRGSLRLHAGGQVRTVQPGEAYLVGAGVVHRVEPAFEGPSGVGDPFRRMFLGPAGLSLLPAAMVEAAGSQALQIEAPWAERLWRSEARPHSGTEADWRPSTPHPAIRRAIGHLETELHRGVSLDELARVCRLSKFHLCRVFHRFVGVTPRTFHRHVRVEHGRALLRTGRPSSRVASDLNFSDQSHFIRSFRRQFGATPGQFLQALRCRSD